MAEIIRNTPFRILFIVVPTIYVLIRKRNAKIDYFIIGLISIVVASEFFTLFHKGYNLIQYSLFMLAETAVLAFMVYQETKKKLAIIIGLCLPILAIMFFLLTEYSSIDLFNISTNFPLRSPMDTHQFFDFNSIVSLTSIILVFMWLTFLVSTPNKIEGGSTKRFIYIFAFLGYFCGGFFTVAFGRYIIGDIGIWFEYWNKIYLPL
jgi:hypothetical protein